MTVKDLIEQLQYIPQDWIVFMPEDWEHHPYMFLQPALKVVPVITDSEHGGTFDWNHVNDDQENIERGLTVKGICIYPDE